MTSPTAIQPCPAVVNSLNQPGATARLIVALTEANKDYDLLIFPEERHMPRDAKGMEYQERRVTQYFKDHL